ncbi:MAG: putative quinol monooxygenase [Slackia sp.]|uniref:putative quinol monooxygenase n=1 Tax=Slackia TaxID=84108 RepID=UPI0023F5055C|nr:antibiotic biosynthesis monooxygenase [Slackia piriformis]
MGNCVLHVRYTVKPGMRNAFVKDVLDSGLLDEVRRENGCLEYCYYCSAEEEDLVLLLEKWTSQACQQAHFEQPHTTTLMEIKNRYVQETHVERFD